MGELPAYTVEISLKGSSWFGRISGPLLIAMAIVNSVLCWEYPRIMLRKHHEYQHGTAELIWQMVDTTTDISETFKELPQLSYRSIISLRR